MEDWEITILIFVVYWIGLWVGKNWDRLVKK